MESWEMESRNLMDQIGKSYVPLSSTTQQELLENLTLRTIEKGEVVVREGQYARKAFYIVKGCARAYYLKSGKDVSDWFAFENEFISPIVSFFGNQPSPHCIEFVEDSIVFEISKTSIDELAQKHHDLERLNREVVTQTMLRQQERIASILFYTAQKRYEQLLTIRPDIIQRVPLTHIASYLGMTLETLSRVRNAKAKRK